MKALVDGLGTKDMDGGGGRCGKSFPLPPERGCVLGVDEDGVIPHVETLGGTLIVEVPPSRLIFELVAETLGLSKDTRFMTTSAGKCTLHTVVYAAVGSIYCRAVPGCHYGTRGMVVVPRIHAPPKMYT